MSGTPETTRERWEVWSEALWPNGREVGGRTELRQRAMALADAEAATARAEGARLAFDNAADEAHKEARWQEEQSRRTLDGRERGGHLMARDRLLMVEEILRDRARVVD